VLPGGEKRACAPFAAAHRDRQARSFDHRIRQERSLQWSRSSPWASEGGGHRGPASDLRSSSPVTAGYNSVGRPRHRYVFVEARRLRRRLLLWAGGGAGGIAIARGQGRERSGRKPRRPDGRDCSRPRGARAPWPAARTRWGSAAQRDRLALPTCGGQGARPGERRPSREEGAEDRVRTHHLRDAHPDGRPDGFLRAAGPPGDGREDRGLGAHPRQGAQPRVRRLAHALADAPGHQPGSRLAQRPHLRGGDREHQRPGDYAAPQAQGEARSQTMEGNEVRRPFRLLDAQPAAALLRRRARARSGQGHRDPRRPAAGDGREPARGKHRRLPRARAVQPARRLRGGRLHPPPLQGPVGRPPLLRPGRPRLPSRRSSAPSPRPPRTRTTPRTAWTSPRRSRPPTT